MQESVRCAAAVSTTQDSRAAAREVAQAAGEQLGQAADLAVAFVSPRHAERIGEIATLLTAEFPAAVVLGCTGESIVAGAAEYEDQSAISLWLARLPGVEVLPMHLEFERSADGGSFVGYHDDLLDAWPERSSMLLLGEPFSFPADVLLARLGEEHPQTPVFGGMASGGSAPGDNRLFLNGKVHDQGAACVLLANARIRNVVSQGCRPIGKPYVVTKAERNVLMELSGLPAMAQLRELWQELSGDDQRLVQAGLHVGQVINEYQDRFERGDFLIRNVVGADPETGVIAIGDYVRVGQTVQFHVRDAASADQDLQSLLAASAKTGPAAAGALLFTCNGRGTRLFEAPHHDAAAVAHALGAAPVAGFFAQGEIGPIGGKNFLHGFTASIAVFDQ